MDRHWQRSRLWAHWCLFQSSFPDVVGPRTARPTFNPPIRRAHEKGEGRKRKEKSCGGRVDWWTGGRVDGWTGGRVDGWTGGRVDGWTGGTGQEETSAIGKRLWLVDPWPLTAVNATMHSGEDVTHSPSMVMLSIYRKQMNWFASKGYNSPHPIAVLFALRDRSCLFATPPLRRYSPIWSLLAVLYAPRYPACLPSIFHPTAVAVQPRFRTNLRTSFSSSLLLAITSSALSARARHNHRSLISPFAGADKLALTDSRFNITSSTPTQQKSFASSATATALETAAIHDAFVLDSQVMISIGDLGRNPHPGQVTPPEDSWKVDWDFDNDANGLAPDEYLVTNYILRNGKTVKFSSRSRHIEQSSASLKSTTGHRVDKRDKYREKNRVAAAKCRDKKKNQVDGLEETQRTQGMLNTFLKHTEQNLRNELSSWRTQALQHGLCDCKAVQDYIMCKARDVAASEEYHDSTAPRGTDMESVMPPIQIEPTMFGDDKDSKSLPE